MGSRSSAVTRLDGASEAGSAEHAMQAWLTGTQAAGSPQEVYDAMSTINAREAFNSQWADATDHVVVNRDHRVKLTERLERMAVDQHVHARNEQLPVASYVFLGLPMSS